MQTEFDSWYDRFVDSMRWCLELYKPRDSSTGKNEKWRRFYLQDESGKQRFIVHIRPVPTKERANLCFGLSENELHPPFGCPDLELRDKSHPTYREFDVRMSDPEAATIALLLAVRVAKHWLPTQ